MPRSTRTLLGIAAAALLAGPVLASPPHGHCPPGLAKKGSCTPPGQAKKMGIGQPVPSGAVYVIPQPVMSQLPPPPVGHRYAIVNNQVVLVSDSSQLIVNILRGLLG
jgi:hypothetical protein